MRTSAPRDLVRWLARDPDTVDDARPHAVFETAFLGLRLDVGMRFRDAGAVADAATVAYWREAAAPLVRAGWLEETADGFRVTHAERARTDAIVLAWRAESERSGRALDSARAVD